MHTDSTAKLNSTLSVDSHCVVNPQGDIVAVKLLFNVLCAVRNVEYILTRARTSPLDMVVGCKMNYK